MYIFIQVRWYIEEPPKRGAATVTESGHLMYKPARDVFGSDVLSIRMKEHGLPDAMTPLEGKSQSQ